MSEITVIKSVELDKAGREVITAGTGVDEHGKFVATGKPASMTEIVQSYIRDTHPYDFGPMTLVGIDPGFENLGYVVAEVTGQYDDANELYLHVHVLKEGVYEYSRKGVPFCYTVLHTHSKMFYNKIFEGMRERMRSATVVIEQQFFAPLPSSRSWLGYKLVTVALSLYHVAMEMDSRPIYMDSGVAGGTLNRLAKRLHIAAPANMALDTYTAKKKRCESVFSKLLPVPEGTLVERPHHICDAYLQLMSFFEMTNTSTENLTMSYKPPTNARTPKKDDWTPIGSRICQPLHYDLDDAAAAAAASSDGEHESSLTKSTIVYKKSGCNLDDVDGESSTSVDDCCEDSAHLPSNLLSDSTEYEDAAPYRFAARED